ncbi:hypothetical protein PC118_g8951 [Phytophthora cactorum]|uniref:BED-type domain-containing protein n=2 Tax=Phytophthora cactorum TaxID=29920 RepID=A0A329RKB6_9STRA|nr:hypothetical protein PC118_g8951 [Phytophthora cactorum]RAW24750.1 hypothetical protein PC110_g18825 [Phytophthora cactorum]
MVPTSSQICIILFTPVEDNMFTCTTCAKTYKKGNGYTNLLTHPRRTHIDYEQDAQEAAPKPAEPTSQCSSRRFILLAFSPVEPEEDLSAQSQFDLIADTMSRYNKPWEAIKFMVGDNSSVNQYIGSKEGAIPLIGCASHRFNLAVKDFLKGKDELITTVHALCGLSRAG